ncbi:MAG: hypothetical protein E3J56_12060 [Candidatus Aminicenantes bacterium]|nr:MAG: hypothetical protein E3J56_12060 [Candidatus Aminicenantes bacterium]
MTIKEQFLTILRECNGYPFNEVKDSLFFDIAVIECPGIDYVKQTIKKVSWWQEHPDALKAHPRRQLQDWFKEEYEFQQRNGPQQLGKIMKEVEDPDHRRWIKALIRN